MSTHRIAEAMERVEAVLRRKPEAGLHDDAPATARWQAGTRFIAEHPGGRQVATDMPTELGGSGDEVTPGWLFRAGLASCAATSILLAAAARGIVLDRLEAKASSRSDVRGLLGMPDRDGAPVYGGPEAVTLTVRLAAAGIPADRLRALVEAGVQHAPIPNALGRVTPVELRIDLLSAGDA
jgi:uncharacterized OsmC-like protein